jgi:hypothetical protein
MCDKAAPKKPNQWLCPSGLSAIAAWVAVILPRKNGHSQTAIWRGRCSNCAGVR